MSDTGHSTSDPGFDGSLDKELITMWQECSTPGGASLPTRQLAGWVKSFDRRIFWWNFVEYAAAVIVLTRAGFEIAKGDRYLIAPLTGIAVVLFIVISIWWSHRHNHPPDPLADARSYRTALLARIDRQIRLTLRVRYWYVLPAWIYFLTVFVSGTVKVFNETPERISIGNAVLGLALAFLSATALCVIVVWLNERFGLRKLQEERKRVQSILTESTEEGPLS